VPHPRGTYFRVDEAVRITGARVAFDAVQAPRVDLSIQRGKILPFETRGQDAVQLDLSGHLLLPGLINSHDHLEFNLFPRVSNGIHANYIEWAASIFHPDCTPLREHLRLPKAIRLVWGGLKNLLSGVTTVSHHNPFDAKVFDTGFPVRVVRSFGWAHSLHFSPDIARLFKKTPREWPFLVHAAEGTDARARAEVADLSRAGVLSGRTALIHGVGIDAEALDVVRRHRSSLVWCPSSNIFTLGRTVGDHVLRSDLDIALGTDSALTGEGDLIDELRAARAHGAVQPAALFGMVTAAAAKVLRLRRGEGAIQENGVADVVAVMDRGETPADALRELRPELVIVGGKIKLTSQRLFALLPSACRSGLQSISLAGRGAYMVDAKVARLHAATVKVLGANFLLAGREVSV
jgi:cytosine/adenosine deaminase-related metal-dependent hydrolase